MSQSELKYLGHGTCQITRAPPVGVVGMAGDSPTEMAEVDSVVDYAVDINVKLWAIFGERKWENVVRKTLISFRYLSRYPALEF